MNENGKQDKIPDVSVIIPAYNVEKYIEECILSIIQEKEINVEIIVVNDGSTDGTKEHLKQFENEDSVKIINQANGGVTCARIAGLGVATGRYVGFVDGDDYIKAGMYHYLYNLAEKAQVDVVLNQQFFKKNHSDISVQGGTLKEGIYRKKDASIEYVLNNFWNYQNREGVLPDLWCNLYKKEYAQKIMCDMPSVVKFAEDEMFIWALLATVESVYLVNCPYYVYRMRMGSVCNTRNENFLTDLNCKYLYLKSVFDKSKHSKILQKQLDYKTVEEVCAFRFLEYGATEFHMFPYEKIKAKSNVILYGAGQVGRSYYRQISANGYCNIIAWCDERYFELRTTNPTVCSPDAIREISDYDYILIAMIDGLMGLDVERKLKEKYLVDDTKIVTHIPLSLVNFIEI